MLFCQLLFLWNFSRLWKDIIRNSHYIVACHAPLSMGFSRQEYYSRLPFPSLGDLHNSGTEYGSPALQAGSLPFEPPGKPTSFPNQWEGTAQTLRSFPNDVSQRFPQCSLFTGIKQSSWGVCFHFVDIVNLIIGLFFPLFSETQSQIWGSPLAIIQHLWHALCIFLALSHFSFPFSFFHPLFLHLPFFPLDKCSLNLFWQAVSE